MKENMTMSNLSYEGKFLRMWNFSGNHKWRIYFNPYEGEGYGFEFAVIEPVAIPGDEEIWDNNTEIAFVMYGVAYFDGIRHLHIGSEDDNMGYINYPNLKMLSEILIELRKLEIKFCTDPYYGLDVITVNEE